jgi:hypothetical protein
MPALRIAHATPSPMMNPSSTPTISSRRLV